MPVFRYQGIDQKGKKSTGLVDAEHEKAARAKLRKSNVYPTVLVAEGGKGSLLMAGQQEAKWSLFTQRVKTNDVALMTRQFASLLGAGIPLVDALAALVEQMEQPALRSALASIKERITEGEKLSHTLKQHPKIFGDLYINMVAVGEASGTLEQVLERLADILAAQEELRSKIVGALTYPAIMGGVGFILMIVIVTYIVPTMTQVLVEMGTDLPIQTKALMWLSEFIIGWWWILAAVVGGGVWFARRWMRTPEGRATLDRKMLSAAVIGNLVRLTNIARVTRTLGTLLGSGVQMLTALEIVRNIVANTVLKQVIEETRDAVKEGASLAEPLRRSGHFPPLTIHMIQIGEKTGELEKMLERVAGIYDKRVDDAIKAMLGLMQPIMLLLMGGMVMLVVVSVMMPMLNAGGSGVG